MSSQTTTQASTALVSSTNFDSELRTTVLASVDISLTTVSPLTPDGVRDNEKVANDVESNLMGTTVRGEVTDTIIATTAPVIPNQSHQNTESEQNLPDVSSQDSPNNLDIQDKTEGNIPQLNVDVGDLIPSLQDQGLDKIKRQFQKKLFQPNNINFFASQLFI